MQVDIQDVLFWMDAIRDSEDRYRTLESFWKGQVNSKIWLIEQLEDLAPLHPVKIVIYGGWNGVLSSLLFNSNIKILEIVSVDVDPACETIATTINKRYEMQGKFRAVTADMCDYTEPADIIINTSCEHITQEQHDGWLSNQPDNALFVMQGNNYYDLEEHIRCASDIDDFTRKCKIKPYFRGEFETPKYTRFMIMGKKKHVHVR